MRVSVVVPTYRRPEALTACLAALAGQSTPPDEVLVVARRDDETTQECIRRAKGDGVRLLLIDVPAGQPGFVAALNAGVAASRGEIVCFTDDDAEPWPDWISRILSTFAEDPAIAAVGGRDWVYHGDYLESGEEVNVGTVSWWGKVIGRHHLGIGPARDTAVLKGVNLSVRGDLIREVGFDRRLRGRATEHHSELGMCLKLLRMGYRIVYDPAIAVDHRPRPRALEDRVRDATDVRDAAHNETLALMGHLSPLGQLLHLAWVVLVGSRVMPGFASFVRLQSGAREGSVGLLRGNLSGRRSAIGAYFDSRIGNGRRREHSHLSAALSRPRVMGVGQNVGATERAQRLLAGLPGASTRQVVPGFKGLIRTVRWAIYSRARVLYLVDVGKATAVAALFGRLTGKRIVVDTGDASYALARSVGGRGFASLALVGVGEQIALRSAHEIVIRGRLHAAHVPRRATHIPDLPPPGAGPVNPGNLRHELALEDAFVVGLVGSLNFSARRRVSYGWDLIEALAQTDQSVKALIVGDGTGLEPLRARAEALGVADRCRFVGLVSVDRVFPYIGAMNAAISTQTNDIVGQVRTTGKLPLYLACGCPVIASHVGEAAILLGPLGWTRTYVGSLDRSYPNRLAEGIEAWRRDPQGEPARRQLALQLAAQQFDVPTMQARVQRVIARVES